MSKSFIYFNIKWVSFCLGWKIKYNSSYLPRRSSLSLKHKYFFMKVRELNMRRRKLEFHEGFLMQQTQISKSGRKNKSRLVSCCWSWSLFDSKKFRVKTNSALNALLMTKWFSSKWDSFFFYYDTKIND